MGTLLLAASVVALVNNMGPFAEKNDEETQKIDLEDPSDEQVDAGVEIKKQTIDTSSGKPALPGQENSSSQDDSEDSKNVDIEITNPRPLTAGDSLKVNTLIQTAKAGTCTLTLSRTGQQSIVKTAPTQLSGSISTCQGFTIDTSGLSSGTWSLTIRYSSTNGLLAGSIKESVSI